MNSQKYDLKEKKCSHCHRLRQAWEVWVSRVGDTICEDCLHLLRQDTYRKDLFKKISLTILLLSVILLVGLKTFQQDKQVKTESKELILKSE